MKISNRIEQIFSHAVALNQSGGFRNTVYVLGNAIYILNYDSTILLRFLLRKSESPFKEPVSFRANDYDSKTFYEEDGKIVFEKEQNGFLRKKTSGKPDLSPEDMEELFGRYSDVHTMGSYAMDKSEFIPLPKELLGLLNPDLSHIEFSGDSGGGLRIVQRNIYSGEIIEIQPIAKGLLCPMELDEGFGPIALRTSDFAALFSFQDLLLFQFQYDYITVKSDRPEKMDMKGFLACCLYDEIDEIREAKK